MRPAVVPTDGKATLIVVLIKGTFAVSVPPQARLSTHTACALLTLMTTFSQRLEEERLQRRETLRLAVREQLHQALAELAPGEPVIVFGSLTQPRRFHDRSDVDVAFIEEPRACSLYGMQARLTERLGRSVDVLILGETRLRAKIEREGERWMS